MDFFIDRVVPVILVGLVGLVIFSVIHSAANPPPNQIVPGTTTHCIEGVMYLRSRGVWGSPSMTVMVDAEGKPRTCEVKP